MVVPRHSLSVSGRLKSKPRRTSAADDGFEMGRCAAPGALLLEHPRQPVQDLRRSILEIHLVAALTGVLQSVPVGSRDAVASAAELERQVHAGLLGDDAVLV